MARRVMEIFHGTIQSAQPYYYSGANFYGALGEGQQVILQVSIDSYSGSYPCSV